MGQRTRTGVPLLPTSARLGPLLLSLLLLSLIGLVVGDPITEACSGAQAELLTCSNPVYCHGDLLRRVQTSDVFDDGKTFVDLVCKTDERTILKEWQIENPRTPAEIRSFLDRHFLPAGSDVEAIRPADWPERSPLLQRINHPQLREFVDSLHQKWLHLVRRWKPELKCGSGVQLPFPFVVPGDRFRESYYWDSYWSIKGLLLSGMRDTARQVILNFVDTFRTHGIIPNGQRVYYLNRSQPPLLTRMVAAYVDSFPPEAAPIAFLREVLPELDREHAWWMEHRTAAGINPPLNLYNVTSDHPRPESYTEDFHTCQEALRHRQQLSASALTPEKSRAAAREIFSALASGAESGWDFSSRFMADRRQLSSLRTHRVVPVDLNVFLHANELALARFHRLAGSPAERHDYFRNRAVARAQAIRNHLWQPAEGRWRDLVLDSGRRDPPQVGLHLSDLFPLLSGGHLSGNDTTQLQALVQTYRPLLRADRYGLAASDVGDSGQQWDGPNVWAPINQLVMEALLQFPPASGLPELGWSHARNLFRSMFCGWVRSRSGSGGLEDGLMYEKYHAERLGAPGGGGEYPIQTGFGWSNGVALYILDQFADRQQQLVPSNCPTM